MTKKMMIAHATDLHPDGGVAFEHSVAMARDARAVLYSYHATQDEERARRMMPDAAGVLAQWHGTLAEDKMIEHHKIAHEFCEDPVDTLLDAMKGTEPDFMIVGTHQWTGWKHFTHGSVAESLASNINIPTLFLPIGKKGFINEETGHIELKRILIPIETQECVTLSVNTLQRIFGQVGAEDVEVILLHINDDGIFPEFDTPELERGWHYLRFTRVGDLVENIQELSRELEIDMIAMTTKGHDSLWDMFRGSQTERVVRRAMCPLFSIPHKR